MATRNKTLLHRRGVTRRDVLRTGAGAASLVALGSSSSALATSARAQEGESITFLSTQLKPVEEAEKMRTILEGSGMAVEFIPEDDAPFTDRVRAEAEAGQGTIGVLGALHGGLEPFAADGQLTDLSDLVEELSDRPFVPQYLELARFAGEQTFYIPWMQATYIMATHRDALPFLPDGVDEEALSSSLTYEQLGAWINAVNEEAGPRFGLPAGAKGLLPRFFQGYGYPSFTGGLNTTFRSPEAVAMWQWLQSVWPGTNPQSTNYENMQEPLRAGEVWIAWDHTARLIGALNDRPEEFVTFPAPRGPMGLGYLPVIAGLAIPANAPDPEASRALIEFLTRPETQIETLREVSFFPAIDAPLPEDLAPGTKLEAATVAATTEAENVVTSVLPIGLGDQNEAYSKVFRDTFQQILLDEQEIQPVLDAQAENLQAVLDAANAACWAPDPPSEGVCQVG